MGKQVFSGLVYEDPNPLTVSTSEAHVLATCKRRYYYEYQRNRRPREQGHEAVWGAALHRGLEVLYMQTQAGNGPDTDIMAGVLSAALTPGHDAEGRPYSPPADPYARAALSAMLRAYVEYWWTDPSRYEVVSVELAFVLPVKTARGRLVKGRLCELCGGGGGVPGPVSSQKGNCDSVDCPACCGVGRIRGQREGRIDLVLRERDEPGRILVVEHKSTGWPPGEDRYYTGIEHDLQTALYFDAACELGLHPAAVLYDVVRRPDYRDPKPAPALKKDGTVRAQKAAVQYSNPRYGETLADYEARIYTLATAEETRDQWFGRRELPITEEQIRETRAIMHSAVDEVKWRERTGHWPKVGNRYVCAPPKKKDGPKMVCPWIDVCGGQVIEGTDLFERLFPLKRKEM